MVAGFHENLADDSGDLRLDVDLIAGLDLARQHCGFLNALRRGIFQ